MPIVRLTNEEWYTKEAERVLECLRAWLPHEGMTVAEVKDRLAASGFSHSDEEWIEITKRLVATRKVTIT